MWLPGYSSISIATDQDDIIIIRNPTSTRAMGADPRSIVEGEVSSTWRLGSSYLMFPDSFSMVSKEKNYDFVYKTIFFVKFIPYPDFSIPVSLDKSLSCFRVSQVASQKNNRVVEGWWRPCYVPRSLCPATQVFLKINYHCNSVIKCKPHCCVTKYPRGIGSSIIS